MLSAARRMSTIRKFRAPVLNASNQRQGVSTDAQSNVHPASKDAGMRESNGTPSPPADKTTLQKHVLFWDRDGDGVIYPVDTFVGFRALGFNYVISCLAPVAIHGLFSYSTQTSWLPDPLFSIRIRNMHRTKHGSDTGVYDTDGRFVQQNFDRIFAKFDHGNKGALSWPEIQDLVYSNMNVADPIGWSSARLEWWAFWQVAKDEEGLVSREKFLGMYDGTVWDQIAAEVEAKRKSGRM